MTTTLIAVAPTPPQPPSRSRSRGLLACGLLAGPLFVAAFLLQGASRGEGYDPMRHPVSSLAIGPWGWIQIANFLVAGALTLAFAIGLRRATGLRIVPLLIGIWGVGLLGAGAFVGDPISGYPVGTPPLPTTPTWHGLLHDYAFSAPGFLALFAAMAVMTYSFARRRAPLWSVYSGLSGAAFLALFVVFGSGFEQHPQLVDAAGLWQRLCVSVGWIWVAAVAWRSLGARSERRA